MQIFGENRLALAGAALLLFILVAAIVGPVLSPWDPGDVRLPESLRSPDVQHPFGTDQLGRDVLARVLHGARISLGIGLLVTAISLVLGTALGLIAGFARGYADLFFVWLFDTALAIPGLLLAIAVVAVLGPGILNVIIALSIMGWVGYARLARGMTLRTRESDYIAAARLSGVSNLRIMFVHVLPNIAGPLLVQATLGMAAVIITESTLSFLGLSGDIDAPSWGAMLNDGLGYMLVAPHMTIFPGIGIALAVLALNFIGDGLRDRLDPRTLRRS